MNLFNFEHSSGTNPYVPHHVVGAGIPRGKIVIGREYFVRQAATLLRFAKTTTNPELAASLVDKAADLKSQVDETGALPDLSPLAPDIEPPPTK